MGEILRPFFIATFGERAKNKTVVKVKKLKKGDKLFLKIKNRTYLQHCLMEH
jgi:hypothetical protein